MVNSVKKYRIAFTRKNLRIGYPEEMPKLKQKLYYVLPREQALRTNYIKHIIAKSIESPLCRMCGKCGESVQHIVSGCDKLAQKDYKRRYNNVAKKFHWDLCKRHDIVRQDKWHDHIPDSVAENASVKLLFDINIQCDNVIEARRPDIVVIDKKEKVCIIVDIAVPADRRVEEKEPEKVEKYQDLKRETGRMWELESASSTSSVVPPGIDKRIEKLDIPCYIVDMQKTALLGTARILWKILEM